MSISATNRGAKRNLSDFYPTPESVIIDFLQHHKLKEGVVLEPCAGDGVFSKVIKKVYPNNFIDQVEIRCEEKPKLSVYGDVYNEDYLNWTPQKQYKTIITNPPYSLAKEFIEKSFKIANKGTEIIMLLRLAFLESKSRYDFWQKHPVNKLYVLSKRPSFQGNGKSDATAYAWFVWDGSEKQEIKVI